MSGWDGFDFSDSKTADGQPTEYEMISSHLQEAQYSNGVSRQCSDPDKGLGDNVRVDVIRKVIMEISDKIKEARENGKYETKYALSWYVFPLCVPCPSPKEVTVICDMLEKKGYYAMVRNEFYTFIDINWMLIEHPIYIK